MAKANKEHWRLRLIELLDHLEISKAAFGAKTSIDPSYVGRMTYPPGKAGRKSVGPEQMAKINEAFSLPVGWWDMNTGESLPPRPSTEKGGSHTLHVALGRPSSGWPFELVPYERLQRLFASLSQKQAELVRSTMDQQLHAIAFLWENTVQAERANGTAR